MIRVEKEPKEMASIFRGLYERCYFCKEKTDTWHKRTNTPVCTTCGPKHKVAELKHDHSAL